MEKINQALLDIKNLTVEQIEHRGEKVNRYAICDEHRVYATAGRLYHPVTYSLLLGKVQEWVVESKLVSTAQNSTLTKGILTLELPQAYSVDGQDIKTYINIYNSLNSEWPIGILVSPMRVACCNQFVLMKKSAFIQLRYKHNTPGINQMYTDLPILEMVEEAMKGQIKIAEKLVKKPFTTPQGKNFIHNLVKKHIISKQVAEQAESLYMNPVRKEDEGRNAWVLFNTITDPINRCLERTGRVYNFDTLNRVGTFFTELVS